MHWNKRVKNFFPASGLHGFSAANALQYHARQAAFNQSLNTAEAKVAITKVQPNSKIIE
jgi:hypothetical protein